MWLLGVGTSYTRSAGSSSVRSGEIDPSWPIILLLTRLKLAAVSND
jgi:hypothetical protein